MSSNHEGTDTAKSHTTVHTNDVQQGDSIGAKIGQGFSYVVLLGARAPPTQLAHSTMHSSGAMKVIHGTTLIRDRPTVFSKQFF
jgi:hypothetical protein